jgi:hypothetical protein
MVQYRAIAGRNGGLARPGGRPEAARACQNDSANRHVGTGSKA